VRIGVLCRTLVGACCALGCARFSSRPPTLEYAEPSVRVDVRFSEPAFNVDFSLARDETETVLAHCHVACRVQLVPGLYRIRAYGDAPAVQRVVRLRHHTHVFVSKGSAALRSAGLGLEVSGALGLATVLVGGVAAPRERDALPPRAADDGVGNLAILGGLGAAALTFGILLHQTSKSSMQVEEIEDVPWSSQLEPVVDAQGVGFSF
jgi:hypothetical protein